MSDLQERAAQGAAFLDERIPDWHQRIIIDSLRMHNACQCVLGQLMGDYGMGLHVLDVATPQTHGFTIFGSPLIDRPTLWARLRAAWIEEIERRRLADEAATLEPEREVVHA